ncbi:hypothetical protein A2U01_0088399, partial [Trifolium medium]|nr:hypothetical protein [Trifolium medium]
SLNVEFVVHHHLQLQDGIRALLSSAAHRISSSFSVMARGGHSNTAGGSSTAVYTEPSNNPSDVYYVHPSDGPSTVAVKPVLNY